MTAAPPPDGPAPELEHFGAVTAGLSHELSNALATTQAAAGLIEDYAQLIRQGREVDPERFRVAAERVGRSLQRGLQLVEHLHWFAHAIDDPGQALPLGAVTGRIAESAAVLARRRGATLEFAIPAEGDLTLTGGAFAVHRLVYLAVEWALANAANRATVLVHATAGGDDRVVLHLAVTERCPDRADADALLVGFQERIREFGATMEVVAAPSAGLAFELDIPRTLPPARGAWPPAGDDDAGAPGVQGGGPT